MGDGNEPVEDGELLFRRIPEAWYDAATKQLHDEAFAPHKINDTTGLSISRQKYKTIHEAAKGRAGKRYYVAVLKAKDLKDHGIEIKPNPQPDDPGHAELPALNADTRKDPKVLEWQRLMMEMCRGAVSGPFESS